MHYISITGHLKDEKIGLDLYPADQFWTPFVHGKSIVCKNVNHHKLDRQTGNVPLTVTGKMRFWLLQFQAVQITPELTSSQLADGRTETQPQGWACLFVPIRSPSPLQGKTLNKQPLCLEHLPRTETQLFPWHYQTTQWTGRAHKSNRKWVMQREKSQKKELSSQSVYIHKPTHTWDLAV